MAANADENPTTSGPMSSTDFLPWNKGTSTSPEGRLDRLCAFAFLHGGFGDQFGGDLDAFLEARKRDPEVMSEWQSARETCLKACETCSARFSKGAAPDLSQQLYAARTRAVHVFKRSQKLVRSGYRAVLRSKYEKQFPGKIERRQLQTKAIVVDGKKVEAVLLRKLPKDEGCRLRGRAGR